MKFIIKFYDSQLIESGNISSDADEEYEITDPVIPTVLYAKISLKDHNLLLDEWK